jgi:hypothetical protein
MKKREWRVGKFSKGSYAASGAAREDVLDDEESGGGATPPASAAPVFHARSWRTIAPPTQYAEKHSLFTDELAANAIPLAVDLLRRSPSSYRSGEIRYRLDSGIICHCPLICPRGADSISRRSRRIRRTDPRRGCHPVAALAAWQREMFRETRNAKCEMR